MKRIIFIFIMILCLMTCDFFEEVQKMSVEKITPPTPSSPGTTDDYNQQNVLIQSEIFKFNENFLHLTNWDNLLQPVIKQGVYVSHGGSLFLVKNTDEIISGLPADGRVYIRATQSGDFLTFDFVNSATGYSWNYVYCGFYNAGGQQLLPYVLWKDSTDWYKYTLKDSENKYNIEAYLNVIKTIDIGPWNMNGSGTGAFDFIVSLSTYNILSYKIVHSGIFIKNDSESVLDPIYYWAIIGGDWQTSGNFLISNITNTINIGTKANGRWDNLDHINIIINRGYVNLTLRI